MSIKYTNIFHCKTLENLSELGFFGLKINHLATLVDSFFVCFQVQFVFCYQNESALKAFCYKSPVATLNLADEGSSPIIVQTVFHL
jgi:hypothetical protein